MSGDRFIPSRSAMNMNLYHSWSLDGVKEAMTTIYPPGKSGDYLNALAEACSMRTDRPVNNLFAFYIPKPSNRQSQAYEYLCRPARQAPTKRYEEGFCPFRVLLTWSLIATPMFWTGEVQTT